MTAGDGGGDKSKAGAKHGLERTGRFGFVRALIMAKARTHRFDLAAKDGGDAVLGWTVGIAVATVVAYHNSFSVPLFFDDTASIVQNESIRALWPPQTWWAPPAGAGTAGRPLLNLTFALNYAAGGLEVWGYHAVNLAVHVAAAWVLFGLARRTLWTPVLRGKFGGAATEVAGVVALLWAVHPLQTESVTYVSQRAESLVGFFYLLTLYAFVRGAEAEEGGAGRGERGSAGRGWRGLAVGAFFAGVLTKEIIVTAPVVALLYDVTFLAGSWREAWARRWRIYAGWGLGWGLLGGLMIGSRLHERGVGFGGAMSWTDTVATSCEAVALYLKLSVWPSPLVIDYGTTPMRGGLVLAASAVVVGAVVLGTVWAWRKGAAVGCAGAAGLIMLSPTSSLVPILFQPISEHRVYLPLAVVLTVVMAVGFRWWGRRALWAALAIAAVFAVMTERRNRDYRSEEAIWRDTIAKRPDNWRAHNALGSELFRQQRIAEGIAAVEAALRINQTEAKLFKNYANALALPMVGRWAEAIAAGERAVQLDPSYADARNSLANALRSVGRMKEALEQFEAARRLQPESAEIWSNLCDALRQVGRPAEAVDQGEAALRLRPNFPEAHCNLGLVLGDLGRTAEAIAHYEAALRGRPTYVEVLNNLGVALMNTGRLEEARARLEEALRLKPDYAEAHNSRGIVFAKLGRLAEAAVAFETALRIKPDYAGAKENMNVLRAMIEKAASGEKNAPRE